MQVEVEIDASRFLINGQEVPLNRTPNAFKEILGPWDREFDGDVKAPPGFRNNVRYIYDNLGVSLLDHWKDLLVREVTFHFSPEGFAFDPKGMFEGRFVFDGDAIDARNAWHKLVKGGEPRLKKVLGLIRKRFFGRHVAYLHFRRKRHSREVLLGSLSVSEAEKRDGSDLHITQAPGDDDGCG